MMLNIKIVELSETKIFYFHNQALIILLGIGYYIVVINQFNINFTFSNISYWFDYINSTFMYSKTIYHISDITSLLWSTSGTEFKWDNLFISLNQVINIGYILYSYHSILLIIISVILLLAMVSPIVLCFTNSDTHNN